MRKLVRPTQLCVMATFLAACSTSEERPDQPEHPDPRVEETMVYIQTVDPEVVNWVSYVGPLRTETISNMHALLRTNSGVYLLETERMCPSLTSEDIYADMADRRSTLGMADRRSRLGRLRAGIDTLRGCTIETIYRLPDELTETTPEETGQTTTQEPD